MKKTVLVTGADGFIGSHLVELLVSEGYKVRALSQYNSFNYWGWLEDVACLKDIEVVSGDVRDPYFCKSITKDVDTIFHLAALIAIPYSYVAPDSYIDTNVTGTLNICQAALENGVRRVIHTSTSEVYGTAQYVPIDEKHPLQPQSPYSASKIGADAIAMSFYNSFQLPLTIVILRPFLAAVPGELEDAAAVDGANRLGFFWRILLPLSRPALVTVGVLAFVASWNSFLLPLLVLQDDSLHTLPLGVQNFSAQYSQDTAGILAFTSLAMMPALLFFTLAERQIVGGIQGAVKG